MAHAEEILELVEEFISGISDSLRLAALFHDIDRVVNPETAGGFKGERGSSEHIKHKHEYAKRSAEIFLGRL